MRHDTIDASRHRHRRRRHDMAHRTSYEALGERTRRAMVAARRLCTEAHDHTFQTTQQPKGLEQGA